MIRRMGSGGIGPALVLTVWQEKQKHVLSADRRSQFLRRPEIERLAGYPLPVLGQAADVAMQEQGQLLLQEWVVAAESLLASARRAARTAETRAAETRRASGTSTRRQPPARRRRVSGQVSRREIEGPAPRSAAPSDGALHRRISDMLGDRRDDYL